MSERLFSVAEAQALLPELRKVFNELDVLRSVLERRVDQIKILDALWGSAVREPGNPDREEFLGGRAAVRRTIREIDRLVGEKIRSRGLRFPQGGLDHGLVDFPTRYEGRIVYLCWQRDEAEITSWHETDGGFAGRQPLTSDQAQRMQGESHR